MTDKVPQEAAYFIYVVKERFNFLSNYGFRIDEIKGSTVRFESSKVFVKLSYQWYTFEIDLAVGQTGSKDEFSFSDIVNALLPSYRYSCGKIASERKSIDAILGELADFLHSHGESLIVGDRGAFDVLKTARFRIMKDSELVHRIKIIRKQAEKSWRQKNYQNVQKLYGSIKSELTDIEEKRLRRAISVSGIEDDF